MWSSSNFLLHVAHIITKHRKIMFYFQTIGTHSIYSIQICQFFPRCAEVEVCSPCMTHLVFPWEIFMSHWAFFPPFFFCLTSFWATLVIRASETPLGGKTVSSFCWEKTSIWFIAAKMKLNLYWFPRNILWGERKVINLKFILPDLRTLTFPFFSFGED